MVDIGLLSRPGWMWRWQPMIYGVGISLMVTGLAWAGRFGVPRKAPHIETNAIGATQHLAMGLAGSGGLLATAGAAIFVIWIIWAMLKRRTV
jgi:heme/copper-type cytochrome/quinol oxidase subunit 1